MNPEGEDSNSRYSFIGWKKHILLYLFLIKFNNNM